MQLTCRILSKINCFQTWRTIRAFMMNLCLIFILTKVRQLNNDQGYHRWNQHTDDYHDDSVSIILLTFVIVVVLLWNQHFRCGLPCQIDCWFCLSSLSFLREILVVIRYLSSWILFGNRLWIILLVTTSWCVSNLCLWWFLLLFSLFTSLICRLLLLRLLSLGFSCCCLIYLVLTYRFRNFCLD